MAQTMIDPTIERHGGEGDDRVGALPSRVALSSEKWLAAIRRPTGPRATAGQHQWWLAPLRARAVPVAD
jgi:hypothetical protein